MILMCPVATLKKQPALGIQIGCDKYLLVATDNQIRAYKNLCPHLNIPLEWEEHAFLDDESGLIRCSTHGALFLLETGLCVSGPCYGENLQAVSIVVEDGQIFLIG